MFKLTRPCVTCPFRLGQGELFQLHPARLAEIFAGPAFQCHKTLDYDGATYDDEGGEHPGHGDHPQQCAGLMSLLHRAGQPNQIMQVAERLGYFDPGKLDHSDVYPSIAEAMKAHGRP